MLRYTVINFINIEAGARRIQSFLRVSAAIGDDDDEDGDVRPRHGQTIRVYVIADYNNIKPEPGNVHREDIEDKRLPPARQPT